MKTRVVVFKKKDKVVINRVREAAISKRDLVVRPTSIIKCKNALPWITSELLEISCYLKKDKSAILGYVSDGDYKRLKGI